jgi:hypothetical protein
MAKWFELSEVKGLRDWVEERLVEDKRLRPSKNKNESATGFWARVEKAGLLEVALSLYDQCVKDRAKWVHRPRETKKVFADRIEREGRQAEVEKARKKLLEEGYSLREAQNQLVSNFQPLDRKWTRPWETPDPWEAGRLFRKKEDHERLQAEADPDQRENAMRKAAEYRLSCAKWRRDERLALANARRRVREMREEATEKAKSTVASV